MATLPLIRYALDPTGTSPNNKIQGELHTLPARTVRVVATTYGAFYSESVVLRDSATNQVLTKGVQYYPAELYEVPTAKYGKEVCAILVITDPSVSANISIDYQCVGGEFSVSADAVIQQINALQNDNRPIAWGQIIGKPSEYPPSHHLHDLGDIYGFEYVVHAIDRLRDAILVGDSYSHDQIYQYVDTKASQAASGDAILQGEINNHLADYSNPHRTTAAQVGAYTYAQVDSALAAVNNTINAHLNDHNNPHFVTAAQLGVYQTWQVYNKAEVDQAIAAGQAGAQGNLNAHIADHNNPHQVTLAQLSGVSTATYNAGVANLQGQINGKQAVGNYAVMYTYGQFTDLVATGTIYSYNDIWAFYSDGRLKEDVRVIPQAMEKIRKIRGVLYKYRPEAIAKLGCEERDYMGFIAQEIEAVAPEVVALAPFDRDPTTGKSISGQNFLTLQYEKVTALLTEGLKEVDERVRQLEERLGLVDLS